MPDLTRKDMRGLMRLLGSLQTYIESEIDAHVVAGTAEAMPEDAAMVAELQKHWKQAEGWVGLFEDAQVGIPFYTRTPPSRQGGAQCG